MIEIQRPTRVGQHVLEPYGDTRGTVTGFDGDDVLVEWDEANALDQEVGNFQRDQLEVINEAVRIEVRELLDPGCAPEIEVTYTGGGSGTRYVFTNGTVATSREQALRKILSMRAVAALSFCRDCGELLGEDLEGNLACPNHCHVAG